MSRFEELNLIVKNARLPEFYILGKALDEIRMGKLYRDNGYNSFREYHENVLPDFKKSQIYNLIHAIPIKDNVRDLDPDNKLGESHCTILRKLKTSDLQRKAVQNTLSSELPFNRESLKSEVNKLLMSSSNSVSAFYINTVVRIVGKNPEIKPLHNCWGVVTRSGENSYDVETCFGKAIALHPQYIMELKECDFEVAKLLMKRIKAISQSETDPTVNNLLKEIATQSTVILSEWQKYLLDCIEQKTATQPTVELNGRKPI